MSENEQQLPQKNNSDPFRELMFSMNSFFNEKPIKGFLQQVDEFFQSPFPPSTIPLNVNETDKGHIITAKLPGIKKEQIHLEVAGNYLTISIRHMEIISEEDEKKQAFQKKQTYQQSSRTISLPHLINEKTVKASYQNGLLEVFVPKQKGRTITIDS